MVTQVYETWIDTSNDVRGQEHDTLLYSHQGAPTADESHSYIFSRNVEFGVVYHRAYIPESNLNRRGNGRVAR